MKKITFLFLTLISSNIYSQEFIKLTNAKNENPTVVYNSKIIGNLKIVDSLDLKKIKEVTVFKNKPQSDKHTNHFNNLSEYGLISIKIDKEIKSRRQSELNIFFGFKSNNPI